MTATGVERGRWYPAPPPALDGETGDTAYTDRLTGADGTDRIPYDHHRNRQCSIGYHSECTDPAGEVCQCPHHKDTMPGDGTVAWPTVVDVAAVRLGEMYDLPESTSVRVMLIAAGPDVSGPLGGGRDALRDKISAVYKSQITDWFVTDVLNIYGAAVAGTLR